jgi:hypothetical protein
MLSAIMLCHILFTVMLNIIMLSVTMLNVVVLSVVAPYFSNPEVLTKTFYDCNDFRIIISCTIRHCQSLH